MKLPIKNEKNNFVFFCLIILGFISTNPSLGDHREEVLNYVKKNIKQDIYLSSDKLTGSGSELVMPVVSSFIDSAVKRRNIYLFSMTVYEVKGVQKVVGFGVFGHVWIYSKSKLNNIIKDFEIPNINELENDISTSLSLVDTSAISDNYQKFEFVNNTKSKVQLAICQPINWLNDWHSFGWIEIEPGGIYKYHSSNLSPEIYYYAYSDDKEYAGDEEICQFAIDSTKVKFEYHLPRSPTNFITRKFISQRIFNSNQWPFQVIFQ